MLRCMRLWKITLHRGSGEGRLPFQGGLGKVFGGEQLDKSALKRLSTSGDHITDCQLDSVVYTGVHGRRCGNF